MVASALSLFRITVRKVLTITCAAIFCVGLSIRYVLAVMFVDYIGAA